MKTWLEAHRRVKVVATDQWYLDFVNDHDVVVRLRVEYEWKPLKCGHCSMFGHKEEERTKKTVWLTGETGDNLSVGIRKVTDVTFLFIR